MAWAKMKTVVVVGVGILLAGGTGMVAFREVSSGKGAYILTGSFEDVFAGIHNNSGVFTFRAFESNALVDLTHENGYREITGTDGQDTVTYLPFTGDKSVFKYRDGRAEISGGRFPTNAHLFGQILWLACVNDPELLSKLPSLRFSFFDDSNPGELTLQVKRSGVSPDWVESIRWYAPGYVRVGGNTNRYELSLYPNGWLKAEVSVTGVTNVGQMVLPTGVTYTQFSMKSATNPAEVINLQKTITGPDDVVVVGTCSFSVDAAQAERPLSSYLPRIIDDMVEVHDRRIARQVWIESRRWYDLKKQTPAGKAGSLIFDQTGRLRLLTLKDGQGRFTTNR